MKKLSLFGTGVVGKSAVVTAQRRLNCYYEFRVDGDKANIAIYGTPGLTLFSSNVSSIVRGVLPAGVQLSVSGQTAMTNYLPLVSGTNFVLLKTDGTTLVNGTPVNTTTGNVSLATNGTQILVVDGTNGYIFTPSTNTFARIVSAGFPNGAKTCVFLGGFFIVENAGTGQFYISSIYDGTTWDALQFATAEQNPDNLLAVDADHGYLILFGQNSIEFWQLNGASPFPFGLVQGATAQWGLAAIFSRAHIDNSIIFLAQNNQGQVRVMELQGFLPTPISTPDIEEIINSFSVVSDAVALSYLIDGHGFYQITFPTAARSFLYDCSTQMWSEVMTSVNLTGRHQAQFSAYFNGNSLVTDYANGNIYTIDPLNFTDNGTSIKRLVQSRHITNDSNVVSIDEIYLDMETGVGLNTGQGSNPLVAMQVSKDGGRTWGNERYTTAGAIGAYKTRAIWRRIGSARDFVFRFWMTDPVKWAITYGAATTRERRQ